jgi:hypothetical protein
MKTLFITAGFIGLWAFAANLPAALVTPIAIVALVAIFTAASVAISKWVKNV